MRGSGDTSRRPTVRRSAAINQACGGRGGRGGPGAGGGPPRSREPYRKVTPEGGRFWDPKTQYSCAPTPWGELIAVNANTGDVAWRVPLGSFDELEQKGIKAGRPSLGGAITTAGDLVFIAATTDGYFRAFDARNGAEAVVDEAHRARTLDSVHLHGQGRQAVRGDHGRRRRIPSQPAERRSRGFPAAVGA